MLSKNKSLVNTNQKGSSLSLPAHGRAGARATSSLAVLFTKQKNEIRRRRKARAGKNSFPPTLLLFARPSENYQNSASGFSLKKVRILFKTDSQFVKFRFPASLGASPLASANEFSSNFQTSQSFFRPKGERKAAIFCPKAITNLIK